MTTDRTDCFINDAFQSNTRAIGRSNDKNNLSMLEPPSPKSMSRSRDVLIQGPTGSWPTLSLALDNLNNTICGQKFNVERERFIVDCRGVENCGAHTALIVWQFLAASGVVTLDHSCYSPDLAPADFFLFPRLKSALKGKRFTDITNIQSNLTAELKAILKELFYIVVSRTYILVPNNALPSMEIILKDKTNEYQSLHSTEVAYVSKNHPEYYSQEITTAVAFTVDTANYTEPMEVKYLLDETAASIPVQIIQEKSL
ncbi:hypothetical protein TNCV_2900441 [Trichonephila clavipes]|nr:hypothetical protein TNCV_2900441 [Trichonephila clavipes]